MFFAFKSANTAVSAVTFKSASFGAYNVTEVKNLMSLSKLSIRLSKLICEDDISTMGLPAASAACFASSVCFGVALRPCSLRTKVCAVSSTCSVVSVALSALITLVTNGLNGLNDTSLASVANLYAGSAALTALTALLAEVKRVFKAAIFRLAFDGL